MLLYASVFSSFHELIQSRSVRRPSVRPSVCKLLRKSLLLAGKWPDRHRTCTRWTPGQHASRVCSRSRSRSKVTWYGHFCAGTKITSSRGQMAGSPLAHDGLQVSVHPGCAQGQGQGQRSRASVFITKNVQPFYIKLLYSLLIVLCKVLKSHCLVRSPLVRNKMYDKYVIQHVFTTW